MFVNVKKCDASIWGYIHVKYIAAIEENEINVQIIFPFICCSRQREKTTSESSSAAASESASITDSPDGYTTPMTPLKHPIRVGDVDNTDIPFS